MHTFHNPCDVRYKSNHTRCSIDLCRAGVCRRRYCPECRARASNPHANIALLRVLEHNAGGTGAAGEAGISMHACCRTESLA